MSRVLERNEMHNTSCVREMSNNNLKTQDNQGCYSSMKALTPNEMQTDSKGSYAILAPAVTIWAIASVGQHEQYIL